MFMLTRERRRDIEVGKVDVKCTKTLFSLELMKENSIEKVLNLSKVLLSLSYTWLVFPRTFAND